MPPPHAEADLLPLSGLAHMVFCPRRWALIHLEGLWRDNIHTAQGADQHRRVHEAQAQWLDGALVIRSLALHSLALGLSGAADVVELRPDEAGAALPGLEGRWRLTPVEHKKGRPQPDDCYAVQLCAQAMCLEEMTGAAISHGFLFHAGPRRRQEVALSPRLRQRTAQLAGEMHRLRGLGQTPPAQPSNRCRGCSLAQLCLPRTAGRGKSARRYLAAALAHAAKED